MTIISTKSHEGSLVVTTNDGRLESASAVLKLKATNPEYNQPVLRIEQAGERGGAASIRIDDPNPDIEFVEAELNNPNPNDHGAGKYEIAVQSDQLQINGRKADDTSFETIVVFQRPGVGCDPQQPEGGGNIGFGFKKASTFGKFGGGQGVIAVANACVAPTVSIAGAGILYIEEGALKYRGANGTVTTIALA
jgi:hypothetical protein